MPALWRWLGYQESSLFLAARTNVYREMRGRGAFLTLLDCFGEWAMSAVEVTYFSDVLCVWAYVSQARVNAVKEKFGDTVRIRHQFCSVFGDTARKITTTWNDRGEYGGFNAHLRQVAARFPHIEVHPEVWLKTRPATSTMSTSVYESRPAVGARCRSGAKSVFGKHFRSSFVGFPLRIFSRLPGYCTLGCPM